MRCWKLILIVLILLNINLVLANFTLGNDSYYLDINYGPLDQVSGWINISLDEEPIDSLLTGFGHEINIQEFLDANDAPYDCFPDCDEIRYVLDEDDSGSSSKTFTLSERQSKIIAVVITEQAVDGIAGLTFDVELDEPQMSCISPLRIDVLDDASDEYDYEWYAHEPVDEATVASRCHIDNEKGDCFDESEAIQTKLSNKICNIITVPPARAYEIGANIMQNFDESEDDFYDAFVTLSSDLEAGACSGEHVTENGEVSCIITPDKEIRTTTEVEVCLEPYAGHEEKLNITYEQQEPACGSSVGSEDKFDFDIFIRPLKYEKVSDFKFEGRLFDPSYDSYYDDDTKYDVLLDDLTDYIDARPYFGNCSEGCIIPIKIQSGVGQEVTISNMKLVYKIGLNNQTTTKIYDLEKTPAFIDMDFEKLDLSHTGFLTPDDFGTQDFTLELGDEEIFDRNISIKRVPRILDIFPRSPSSLVSTNFLAVVEGVVANQSNLTYAWDFGDGSPLAASYSNIASHVYSSTGTYEITVSVKNDYGETSKKFSVTVDAPYDAINRTLKQYKADVAGLKPKIEALPTWIQNELIKVIDTDELDRQLVNQEEVYKDTLRDENNTLVKIMQTLLALDIPYDIVEGEKVTSTTFVQNKDQINFDDLDTLGAGNIDTDALEDYPNAINNWIRSNMEATVDFSTYTFVYRDRPQAPIFSRVKLTINPDSNINELYMIINGDPSSIKLNDPGGILRDRDLGESGIGFIFEDLSESTSIEFIHPSVVSILNLPMYLSPEINNLDISFIPGVCNNNGICESGESPDNCRVDCKPWGLTLLLFIVLLILTIIIYIVMQELYKRRYEHYLFKNKNQLFNLISYMNNSINQGMKKQEIFDKLKKAGWSDEQLNYAWKKLKGERTGMWEIPLFKFAERKKVKQELKKREVFGKAHPATSKKPFKPASKK